MAKTEFPKTGQGIMKPVSPTDLQNDQIGFTHPNLHRRLDIQPLEAISSEQLPREYTIGIAELDSYRATTFNYHDEDSEDVEIP